MLRPARLVLPALCLGLAVAGCGRLAGRSEAADPLAQRAAALDLELDEPGIVVEVDGGRLAILLPEASVFRRGEQAGLLEEGEAALAAIAAALADLGGDVQVVGHTDDTGTDGYSQDLSERQAQAVAEALEAGGISPRRLRSFGLGDREPLAPNDGPRNRSRNRRVELLAAGG